MANTSLSSIPYPKSASANKHKPWIEAEYQGIVMENDNTVLLNPPLFALDKDAPLRYAGRWGTALARVEGRDTLMERQGHRDIHPCASPTSLQETVTSKPCSGGGP